MTACRVSVAVFVVLVALAGCKKKPADGTTATPSDPFERNAERATVAPALDGMTADIGRDKMPFHALGKVAAGLPKPANAKAERAELDAAFAKLWAAWEAFPERMRQQVIRDQTALLTKQGMTPDQARAQAERGSQLPPPLKLTAPNPNLVDKYFTRIEANVPNGVKDEWDQNGGLCVAGSVQYSESLKVHCNGGLTVGLRGRVGVLQLHANGELIADLVELTAPVVEVMPNGPLLLRVGPGTTTVRVTGNAVGALILVRDNSGLKVEGVDERNARQVAVVTY